MIKAVNKNGREATFQERVWEMLPPHKNGWMIKDTTARVPNKIVIPKDIIEYTKKQVESNAPNTVADLKLALTELGVEYGEKDGYLKLKKLYNESQKP